MIQLARQYLWIYTGFGGPPPEVADMVRANSQAKGAAALFGAAWSVVTALGMVGSCIAMALWWAPELAISCPSGRMMWLCLMIAASPLLALPRLGLELANASHCGVSTARLCMAAASAARWG
jgi:hypothetical protein